MEYLEVKPKVVAECLRRMTNNHEAVPEHESLGSAVVTCATLVA